MLVLVLGGFKLFVSVSVAEEVTVLVSNSFLLSDKLHVCDEESFVFSADNEAVFCSSVSVSVFTDSLFEVLTESLTLSVMLRESANAQMILAGHDDG